jgi:hypothetical protein
MLMLRQAQHEDFCFILTLSLSKGEERFALANEMVQRTISSDERRELGRVAGES